MTPLLFLEPLEERALLSGWKMGVVLPAGADPVAVASQYRTDLAGAEAGSAQLSSPGVEEEGPYHRDDDMGNDRLIEISAASFFAIIEKAGLGEEVYKSELSGTPKGRSSPPPATLVNFVPADSGVPAPTPSFAFATMNEPTFAQDLISSTDGTAEMAVPGPLSDSVFLDGWQDGIPPPAPELVPFSNKDLTIIAAYLVETPVKQGVAKVTPTSNPDVGLTDFVVGYDKTRSNTLPRHTEVRSDDASMSCLAGEPRVLVADRAMIVPRSIVPEPSEEDMNDDSSCGERSCPKEAQPEIGPIDRED